LVVVLADAHRVRVGGADAGKEASIGNQAAPLLADGGGADEARGRAEAE
jgi:hypothetical protein